MTPRQSMIEITCKYFKESGKACLEATLKYPEELFKDCIYPREYGRLLNRLGKLPGLQCGRWDYYYTVDVEGKYEELVIPKEKL